MKRVKHLAKCLINYYGYCMSLYGEGIMMAHGCGCI